MSRPVRAFMQGSPKSVGMDDNLKQVMSLMSTSKISHLPVVDNDNKVIGVLSKEDVLAKLNYILHHNSGRVSSDMMIEMTKVSELMTEDAVVVQADDSVDLAIEILLQGEFHCVPVVEEGLLAGIVTSLDVLKGYYEEFG